MAASMSGLRIGGFNFALKRAFDLTLTVPILLIAAPAMAIVAIAIRLLDGPPVLFRQTRAGAGGKHFELLKFRTMRQAADAAHREYIGRWIGQGRPFSDSGKQSLYKMTGDPRITALGAFLRRFSLDELPQLINVLRGEMSLVGPRPAIPYEIDLYQRWHRRRLDALPGLTGLWQVSGRNRLSFDQMVRLDIDYIEHWSLGRDLLILARTPRAVLEGGGQ